MHRGIFSQPEDQRARGEMVAPVVKRVTKLLPRVTQADLTELYLKQETST